MTSRRSPVLTLILLGSLTWVACGDDNNDAVPTSPSAGPAPTTATTPAVQTMLVPTNSVWKYLDNGSDLGDAWRGPNFDDSAWPSGEAELGFGDGDERTVINGGPDVQRRYMTTYFRHRFNVTNKAGYSALTLDIKRDDGAIVYLNGTEVYRTNMPQGPVSFNTSAVDVITGNGEREFHATFVNPSILVEGANVLAVEVHQANGGDSSDLSFDLELRDSRVGSSMTQ